MKFTKILLILTTANIFNACHSDKGSLEKNEAKVNRFNEDSSFIAQNYFKLSNIYLGHLFTDDKIKKEVFYRIIEIPNEEHVSIFIEKISIGEEGGNYELQKRYRIEERMLSLNDGFFSLDSLNFKDSVIVSFYVDKGVFTMNLEKETLITKFSPLLKQSSK